MNIPGVEWKKQNLLPKKDQQKTKTSNGDHPIGEIKQGKLLAYG